jgi:putative peptide maturation system protein
MRRRCVRVLRYPGNAGGSPARSTARCDFLAKRASWDPLFALVRSLQAGRLRSQRRAACVDREGRRNPKIEVFQKGFPAMIQPNENIALEVNGQRVSLSEVLRLAKFSEKLQFLQDAVDAALIRQAASQQGVEVSGPELQQMADTFRLARELHDVEATERWLAAHHLTYEAWELMLEEELLASKLREKVATGHVEQIFAQEQLSFDSATISRIVATDEGVARELRAQVVDDGSDFHILARTHSRDEATRPAGGYVGLVRRTDLEPAVESAVFGSSDGKIVGPFKTDEGWILIKVETIHRASLDEATRTVIKSRIFSEWLSERRRKASIFTPLLEEAMEEMAA